MKQLIFIYLLFQLSAFAQGDRNISVISLEKVNVVYRGIVNPIKIAVPGSKSYTVEAAGELTKIDSLGNYAWNVTGVIGRKALVKIDITMPDNSKRREEKEFEITIINHPKGFISSDHEWVTYEMTHKHLEELELGIIIDNLYIDIGSDYLKPIGFSFILPNQDRISIQGNTVSDQAKILLNKLPLGSVIFIDDIQQYNPNNYSLRRLPSIKIKLVGEYSPNIRVPRPVVSIKHMNILYRGIENNIEITVPDAKSFTVSAPGLVKINNGNYSWNVSNIKSKTIDIDFEIVTDNDSIFYLKEKFHIRDIGNITVTIDGRGCKKCVIEVTQEDLKNAKIGLNVEDYISSSQPYFHVKEYKLELPDGNIYRVGVDHFSESAQKMILQFPTGSIFKIKDISYSSHLYSVAKPELKFMLVDKND